MNLRIFSIISILSFSSVVSAKSDVEDHVIKEVFFEKMPYVVEKLGNDQETKHRLEESFGNFSDQEKIRGLYLSMVYRDEIYHNRTRIMDRLIGMELPILLKLSPDFIKDHSEIMNIMSSEKDPRRFYIISKLAAAVSQEKKIDWIPYYALMLYAKGKIATVSVGSEYYHPEYDDVGLFSYRRIISNLKILHASYNFSEQEENFHNRLEFETNRLNLAKWLKANWPGCENLEIPADALKPKDATRPEIRPDLQSATRQKEAEQKEPPKASSVTTSWRWVIGIGATAAFLLALLKLKSKRT